MYWMSLVAALAPQEVQWKINLAWRAADFTMAFVDAKGLPPEVLTPAFCKGSRWATVVRFSSAMGLNPDWSANEEFHRALRECVERAGR